MRYRIAALILAAVLLAACSGGKAKTLATYDETCPACGMRWTVTLLDRSSSSPMRAEVSILNTGERGQLTLVFNEVGGWVLGGAQATAWTNAYPGVRQNRDAPQQLRALLGTATHWTAAAGVSLPASLAPGSSWKGVFEAPSGAVPPDAAAVILTLGPVQYEKGSPGQPASEFWLTYDRTRPFISLRGNVAITPVP